MYGDPLTPLEQEAIALLLSPDHPVMEAFRAQLAQCRIKSRDFTGVGFYTHIVVPQRLAVPGIPRLILTNAETELDGLDHGAGLNLFIHDGMLDFLEGFTFDEPWPDDPKHHKVKPSDPGSTRDLESLTAALRGAWPPSS